MAVENCLIFNWNSSQATTGISFCKTPTKDDEYRTNWRNNTVGVINCDRMMKAI